MQLTEHVYVFHIDDGADAHPGGSNNFFVGDPKEEMVLIDTGDHKRFWTKGILDYYAELGRPRLGAILITHGHGDHFGGVDRIYEETGALVRAHPKMTKILKDLVPEEAIKPLRSREVIRTGGGVALRVIFTPGHAEDHSCFYLAKEKVLFTGDTVLGSSSSTMADLGKYMVTLQKLNRFRPEYIAPAHGGLVRPPRSRRLVQWYINHRNEREEQVLTALQKGLLHVDEMVKEIYPRNLKKGLRAGAARNVSNHLDKLVKEGRVEVAEPAYKLKA